MYFYWDYKFDNFLFENLNIGTLSTCLIIIAVVFILAFLNEAIKHVQKMLTNKLENYLSILATNNEQTPLNSSELILSKEQIKKKRFYNHVIQSLMYMVNLTIGYILMNISMYFYAGHFVAIILGLTFGYYILNVAYPQPIESCSNIELESQTIEATNSTGGNTPSTGLANVAYDEEIGRASCRERV